MSATRDKPAGRADLLGRRRVCTPVRFAIILSALGLLVCFASLGGQGPAVSAQGAAPGLPSLQEPTLPPRPSPPPPPPPRPTPPPPLPPRPTPPPPLPPRPTSGPDEPPGSHEPEPTAPATPPMPMVLPTSGSSRSPESVPVLLIGFGVVVIAVHLIYRRRQARQR